MKSRLKILLLEDNSDDARLIAEELEVSGFAFRLGRIQTEAELRHEIETEAPDLILSDHGLPSFDGFEALKIVRETHPELPFIFVSGSNDPGMVAEMYEQGATDYVFKSDLADLRSAVQDALATPSEIPHSPQVEFIGKDEPDPAAGEKTVSTRLNFCPVCRQARDEWGNVIQPADYFQSHLEVVVVRTLCRRCT